MPACPSTGSCWQARPEGRTPVSSPASRRRSRSTGSSPRARPTSSDRSSPGHRRDLGRPVDPSSIELDERQLGDGYGRPTDAAREAAELLARTEAILVDPIYTAKALAGLVAGVRSGAWDGQRVVFWHAGGLPGLFEPLD